MAKKDFNTLEAYNEVLFETENFKVIPSLGSLVEGWLLVIPKSHYISYGEINDVLLLEELNTLVDYVCNILYSEYGNYIIFEHGPFEKKSKVGCGVDYAHIHIVPINLKFDEVNSFSNPSIQWCKVEGIISASRYIELGQEYLYFQDCHNNSYLGTGVEIPSQYFRRIIANIIGTPETFDWKSYLYLDNITNTYTRLKKYNSVSKYSKIKMYA